MATVTAIITLRRIEGRTPVDLDDLASNVVDELASTLEGTLIDAQSIDGDDLQYEISGVRLARTADVDISLVSEIGEVSYCEWCQAAVDSDRHGRARRYCSDAHRQAAYRARSSK
jgi:hypothetical protein